VGTLLQTLRYSLPPPLKKPLFWLITVIPAPFSFHFPTVKFYPLETKNAIIENDYND
jgi:hypothetical protein